MGLPVFKLCPEVRDALEAAAVDTEQVFERLLWWPDVKVEDLLELAFRGLQITSCAMGNSEGLAGMNELMRICWREPFRAEVLGYRQDSGAGLP